MATILKTDGTREPLNDLTVESLQKAVGGFFELVPTNDGRGMFVNEDGRMKNLPFNAQATNLYKYPYALLGDAVLLEKEEANALNT